jgi:hypothetical protein
MAFKRSSVRSRSAPPYFSMNYADYRIPFPPKRDKNVILFLQSLLQCLHDLHLMRGPILIRLGNYVLEPSVFIMKSKISEKRTVRIHAIGIKERNNVRIG